MFYNTRFFTFFTGLLTSCLAIAGSPTSAPKDVIVGGNSLSSQARIIASSELNASSIAKIPTLYEGHVQANVLIAALPKTEIKLPDYLSFAPQDFTDKNSHPVLFIFTHQSNLGVPGSPAEARLNYNEAIVYIPMVKMKNSKKIFNYMAQLYLDNPIPTIVGLRLYGYLKDISAISNTGSEFTVADMFSGYPIMKMQGLSNLSHTAAEFLPIWKKLVEKVFSNPVVSNLNNQAICSQYVFNFQEDKVRPTAISQVQTFMGAILGGPFPVVGAKLFPRAEGMEGFKKSGLGSFSYEANYTLSAPAPIGVCM